jgi:transposase
VKKRPGPQVDSQFHRGIFQFALVVLRIIHLREIVTDRRIFCKRDTGGCHSSWRSPAKVTGSSRALNQPRKERQDRQPNHAVRYGSEEFDAAPRGAILRNQVAPDSGSSALSVKRSAPHLRQPIHLRMLRSLLGTESTLLNIHSLIPAARQMAISFLRITSAMIELGVRGASESAVCPRCETNSKRVHSRYPRTIADLPWAGVPMTLRFLARRFFCDNSDCGQSIFAEQLPALAAPRGRQTPRLNVTLVDAGMECGGEPVQRLCSKLGILISGDTILRRLRAMPAVGGHAGNVIGVDDFAFRRGQRYGTIVVDHESGGVIDLLPDRTSTSLETWLTDRATTPTVVTRDRSGVYAKAISTAAPSAVQVADRWHLLANCREALVRLLDRHHRPITAALEVVQLAASDPDAAETESTSATVDPAVISPPLAVASAEPLPKSRQQSMHSRERRMARYEQVLKLHQDGTSRRDIARQMKMSRTQVSKLLNADSFPERAAKRLRQQVENYTLQLRSRSEEGIRNASELARYITTLGYTGGPDMVRRFVTRWRTESERLKLSGCKSGPRPRAPLKLQRPGSNRLSWLLIKDDIIPHAGEQALATEL